MTTPLGFRNLSVSAHMLTQVPSAQLFHIMQLHSSSPPAINQPFEAEEGEGEGCERGPELLSGCALFHRGGLAVKLRMGGDAQVCLT